MRVEIDTAAKGEAPILARLLELYIHDLSAVADLRIGADGRFGYAPLPGYWTEVGRHPYLLRVDGELAGFALVQQGSQVTGVPDVWDMAEFFVLRRYWRRGVGVRAAHELWSRQMGRWEVRVMERNTAALGFWQRAVDAFVGAHAEAEFVEVTGKRWHVFRLTSSAQAEPPMEPTPPAAASPHLVAARPLCALSATRGGTAHLAPLGIH